MVAGTATVLVDGKAVAKAATTAGRATIALPATIAPGTQTLSGLFTPTSPNYLAAKTAGPRLTVRALSATTIVVDHTRQSYGTYASIRATANVALNSTT